MNWKFFRNFIFQDLSTLNTISSFILVFCFVGFCFGFLLSFVFFFLNLYFYTSGWFVFDLEERVPQIFLVFCLGRPGDLNHRVPQGGSRFYQLAISNLLIVRFQSMIIRTVEIPL